MVVGYAVTDAPFSKIMEVKREGVRIR